MERKQNAKSMEVHHGNKHRGYTSVATKGGNYSINQMATSHLVPVAMDCVQRRGPMVTIIDEEEDEDDSEHDGDDHVVTNKHRELDAQSEATMDNPYLQHLMGNHHGAVKMHGAGRGVEASITLTNTTDHNGHSSHHHPPPLAMPVDHDHDDRDRNESVYGPGPISPDHGNVTGTEHPKPAYYVVAADGNGNGDGHQEHESLSPRFEKLKSSRPRGRSSKSRRSSAKRLRRSSRRSRGDSRKSDHLSPSPHRGRGISTVSDAVSELSEITATTLNSDSDTGEGSEDGAQPMTYPTDVGSMGYTTSSSERHSEHEVIAEKGGFQAVSTNDDDIHDDIASMDGDHFETMH